MKKATLGILLGLFSAQVAAQGFYRKLHYRSNDPFLFCTRGLSLPGSGGIPDPCWVPTAPYLGSYTLTGACDPPDEDARPWTKDDKRSLTEYEEVCPQAMASGGWQGSGDPSDKPNSH